MNDVGIAHNKPSGPAANSDVSPRTRQAIASFVLIVLLSAVAALIPVPFVALSPGPTFNTIGEVQGTNLINIRRHQTYPTTGHLDLVTIRETGGPQGGLDLLTALRGWFDASIEIVPRSLLYPPQATNAQVNQEHKEQFADSQGEAVAAAMSYLGIPTTSMVVAGTVSIDGPSGKLISAGEQIVEVNGTSVKKPEDVVNAIRPLPVGSKVTLVLGSGTNQRTEVIVTKEHPAHPGKSYIGVGVGMIAKPPFPIEFGLNQVGGPSAGMMFALGVIDKLTPGAMTGGVFVAGTGTINAAGIVGPIGGIQQKMIGARRNGAVLFVAPKENCDEVVGHIPKGMTVVPVHSLADAVKLITKYGQGTRRGLPQCAAGTK